MPIVIRSMNGDLGDDQDNVFELSWPKRTSQVVRRFYVQCCMNLS